MMRKVTGSLLLFLLVGCLVGCGKSKPPYTEREKELYLTDMADILSSYEKSNLPDSRYDKVLEKAQEIGKKNGGKKFSNREILNVAGLLPKIDVARIDGVIESYRRKYVKTPVDDEFHLMDKVQNMSKAHKLTLTFQLGQVSSIMEGKPTEEMEAGIKDEVEKFEALRIELKTLIKEARES